MEQPIYIDTIGLNIDLNMFEDVSTATSIVLHVTKPNGSTTTWSGATVVNSNFFRYTTSADDLDQTGTYSIQPHYTLGGWTGYGKTVSFRTKARYA